MALPPTAAVCFHLLTHFHLQLKIPSLFTRPSPRQALVTMTPDQRRESINMSNMNLCDKEDKTKAYTLEEFSYDYFRCVFERLPSREFIDFAARLRRSCTSCLPQAASEEHSEQGDDLQVQGEGASVELQQGAPQTASAQESSGS